MTLGAGEGAAGSSTLGNGSAARYPAPVAFGDVNRDGKLELIAATRSNIEVYSLDDAWNASLLAARTISFLPGSPAYQDQFAVASGDLDGDDTDEIIVGYEKDQDSFIQVFKGDLTVSGSALRVFERAKSAPVIHARDWDGDGLADILAGEGACPDNEAILRVFGPQGGLVGEMKAPGDFRYGVVPTFGTIKK
jgi:hypothetical protein